MALAGSVVPVRRRSIPCFVSAAFARQPSNGITKALTIRLFFWSGKFALAATEKNSLIRAENREFATRDRFRRTAPTTRKSAQSDVSSQGQKQPDISVTLSGAILA
jgi:hypothetical protein